MQNAHETKFLLPTHLSALTAMTTTWESSLSVAKEKTFASSSMMAFLGEKDARGLADAVGAEGVPPDLLGVAAADGVVLALAGHAVGGAHWQAMQSVMAGPALMALSLTSSSSIMIRETGWPIRQKALVDTHAGGHGQGGGVGGHRRAAPMQSVLDAKRHWPRR